MDTQVRLGKGSIGKGSVGECIEADKPPTRPRFSPPSTQEVEAYCREKGYMIDPERFNECVQ